MDNPPIFVTVGAPPHSHMKLRLALLASSALVLPVGLVSCATLGKASSHSLNVIQKSSSSAVAKVSQITEKSLATILPPKVKVVEVREKDLKKLPSGGELAQAFENSRKRSFWFFGGPVDFQEPNLPQAGAEMDGSLLPPKEPF